MKKKSRSLGFVLGRVIFLFVLASQAIAQDCELLKTSTHNQIQEIGNDLSKVLNREQYEGSIEKRYDKVEVLLKTANECLHTKKNKDWERIKEILTELRSNARTLVFTKYENWMQIKEKDLSLFQKSTARNLPKSETMENQKPASKLK